MNKVKIIFVELIIFVTLVSSFFCVKPSSGQYCSCLDDGTEEFSTYGRLDKYKTKELSLVLNKSGSWTSAPDISGIWIGEWYSSSGLWEGRSEYHLTQTVKQISGYEYERSYTSNSNATYDITGSIDTSGKVTFYKTLTYEDEHSSSWYWCTPITWNGKLSSDFDTISGSYYGGGCSGNFVLNGHESYNDNDKGQTEDDNSLHGDPVNILNGNLYVAKTDLSTSAPGIQFEFIRAYNSMEETDGPLGVGWTHNFNVKVSPPVDETSVAIVTDTDGGVIEFSQISAGIFNPPTGDYSALTKDNTGFTWKKKEKITYSFNSQGTLQSIKDKNSNAFSLSYNSQGRLSTITDTAGRNYTITYDTSGRITRIEDATDRKVSYEYDSNGNLVKTTDAGNAVTVYEYDDANDAHNITKQTVDNKFVYTYSYDAKDWCITAVGQNGESGYKFEYKPEENRTLIKDSRGNVVTKYHSVGGKVSSIVYSDNSEEYFNWDGNFNKVSETRQDGNTWQYEYDNNGNVTKVIDPFGNQKVMTYDNDDNLTSLTDELERITNYSYDSNGNLTKITYPDETYTTFTYNSRGQPLTITDTLGKTTTFAYDTQGNLSSATDPGGNAITYAYDSLGRRTSITDKRGNVTKYQYDALNRVVKVTDAKNGEVNTTHTIAGIGSLNDQNSNTTTFLYDSLNQLTGVTDPLSKAKQFNYDDNGNLASRMDFNGNSTSYTYDSLNRLTSVKYPDSSQITYIYDSMGRLTQMTDAAGTSKYTYDAVGRITSYTNGQDQSVSYAYDKTGNLTSLTYPGSRTVTYTYDSQNRLTKVSDWSGRETLYSYDQRGLLTKATLPNSTTVQYEYDNAGRITTLKNLKSDGSVIASYSYTLDKNGNIVSEAVNQPLSPEIQSQSVNYTYGSDNRLLNDGNTSFTYDQNGNLTKKGDITFQYDYEDRLKKVTTSSGTWEYEYDGIGNRVGLKSNGNTRRFLLDPTGITYVLAEYDSSGNLIASYIYGAGLVYRVDASDNPYYYHYNFTGSTVAMSDASGNVVNKYAYTPFGALVSSDETVSNPFRYVGKFGVMDDENGLFYMRARYYDPEVGRFTTKDPIGFNGGVNLFEYVGSNPVSLIDPEGLLSPLSVLLSAVKFHKPLFRIGRYAFHIGLDDLWRGVHIGIKYITERTAFAHIYPEKVQWFFKGGSYFVEYAAVGKILTTIGGVVTNTSILLNDLLYPESVGEGSEITTTETNNK
jgi:RHS repeat-associated protein